MPEKKIISWEKFRDGMTKKYKQDFIDKVQEHSKKYPSENQVIDQTRAEEYFDTFVKALYNNRIEDIGTYGKYFEGDERDNSPDRRKGRQDLVNAFHQEVSEFITAFGPVAAKGKLLLWSSYGIGRFAADDKDILRSAGVTDENAQPLDQTNIGKLWDVLKIADNEYDQEIGYIWDNKYQVWASVSKEIAANATGEVHVFIPKNIGATTIFWNVELTELRKRMAPLTDDPKVNSITIHRLTDDALENVNKAADDDAKKQVMVNPRSWENLDFSNASLDVPKFSDRQKELLRDSNPLLFAEIDNYVKNDKNGAITISKLIEFGLSWKGKASRNVELYRIIGKKYGYIPSVPFEIAQKMAEGKATNGELIQYGYKFIADFQKDLSTRKPENYNDSDMEIVTRLLYENYTRLQEASSRERFTQIISKDELQKQLERKSGDPKLMKSFSHLDRYSQKLSAREAIEGFGLDYEYQNDSRKKVKPYLMSVGDRDRTLPFVYYVTTPMTDDIKTNAKIPLDPEVKKKLEAIANDTKRDDSDELKKMAKELTTSGVYHELTPNTDKKLPKYGTKTDGKESYAGMLLTTYSETTSKFSPGTMIRAKGPNGEDFKIADWDGLTWTISPQSQADLPDWLKSQGRLKDRLNVDTDLKVWKAEGDKQITAPKYIPKAVRAFMASHFNMDLSDITIQQVNDGDNDDSTATLIQFKPGEYDDTTPEGLKKIAKKLGDALKLKFTNSSVMQNHISEAITKINNELSTKSVSIKNDLMKLRHGQFVVKADAEKYRQKSKYTTGTSSSVSDDRTKTHSKR